MTVRERPAGSPRIWPTHDKPTDRAAPGASTRQPAPRNSRLSRVATDGSSPESADLPVPASGSRRISPGRGCHSRPVRWRFSVGSAIGMPFARLAYARIRERRTFGCNPRDSRRVVHNWARPRHAVRTQTSRSIISRASECRGLDGSTGARSESALRAASCATPINPVCSSPAAPRRRDCGLRGGRPGPGPPLTAPFRTLLSAHHTLRERLNALCSHQERLNLAFNPLPSAFLRGRVRFGAFSDGVVLGGAGAFRSWWAAGVGSAGFRNWQCRISGPTSLGSRVRTPVAMRCRAATRAWSAVWISSKGAPLRWRGWSGRGRRRPGGTPRGVSR